jgi:protoporphyrinogen oxidase
VEWDPRPAAGGPAVTRVRYGRGGSAHAAEAEHLIWTAPLPELIRRLDPPAPAEVQKAVARLRHRGVVLCYVALGVPRVGEADTYYFPERRFPFNRVIEQKNFGPEMVPAGRTVLGMDLACEPDGDLFGASDAELASRVVPALEEAGLARRSDVVEVFSRRFRHAYPVYDLDYAPALERAMDWLGAFSNLWLAGRQGLFLHNNTHHSLLMGYQVADAIAAGGRREDWEAALADLAGLRVAD